MKTLLLLTGALALASTSPALAKPGKGHGNHAKHGVHSSQFGYGNGGCPPGLAKKNNGCRPPGQAKKLFAQGQRVPYGYSGYTDYNRLPYDLRSQYNLDPRSQYIYQDDYLYQVDPRTSIVRQILSAIL